MQRTLTAVGPSCYDRECRLLTTLCTLNSAYSHLLEHIRSKHPKFAYVHMVEDTEAWRGLAEKPQPRSNDVFRSILRAPIEGKKGGLGEAYPEPDESRPTLFITCGDYKTETALAVAEAKGDLVAIGRSFISK